MTTGAGSPGRPRLWGGEGTNSLTVKATTPCDVDVLDAALPPDAGDGPVNGGWFPGPEGWLLLVEGLDEGVTPWIEDLAAWLSATAVQGTLTGAGSVGSPMWARRTKPDQGFTGEAQRC